VWVNDPSRVHPNNLATSLAEFEVILALVASGLRRTPVALPFTPEAELLPALRSVLSVG
jgi:hypothetical protein